MMKKIAATLLTLSALAASMPMNVFAATQTVDPAQNDSFEITASANVTAEDLAALGLNVIVSFPAEIALSLDDSKDFSGNDKIYAYGIMDTDNTLAVTIDTANEAYGKVMYRADGTEPGVTSANNFASTVVESLSAESFTPEQTLANYLAKAEAQAMPHASQLDVKIQNLLPTHGTGLYYTNVPLKIAVQ